jgi:hypothetical protein
LTIKRFDIQYSFIRFGFENNKIKKTNIKS